MSGRYDGKHEYYVSALIWDFPEVCRANSYKEAALKIFREANGYDASDIWEVTEADSYILSVMGASEVRYFWVE